MLQGGAFPGAQGSGRLPDMVPRYWCPEPLSPAATRSLSAVARLAETIDAADIFLLSADIPLRAIQAQRDTVGSRLIIGYTDQEPTLEARIRWIRAGAEDLVSEDDLPRSIVRLWKRNEGEDAKKVSSFLSDVSNYLEQRNLHEARLGERGAILLADLGRRREAVSQRESRFPSGFQWPVQVKQPACVGNIVGFGADILQLAVPMALKGGDELSVVVQAGEYEFLVDGEVLRMVGTSGIWWVANVLMRTIKKSNG